MMTAIIVMTVIGTVSAMCLAVASRYFSVPADPNVEAVSSLLSGANCGGCGYAGCTALAKAIAAHEAPANACPGLDDELVAKISGIVGTDATSAKKLKAFVKCAGGKNCADKYEHFGLVDCLTMSLMEGGQKMCLYGCLGGGNCVRACPFDAMNMTESGIVAIDMSKCIGCGVCVPECPKKLIALAEYTELTYAVGCASHEKGGDVRKKCTAGCIGCKMCEKKCTYGAITVTDFLASIDTVKCTGCGECVFVCPTGSIKQIIIV